MKRIRALIQATITGEPPAAAVPEDGAEAVCRHCRHTIVCMHIPGVIVWTTPLGGPLPAGVTLPIECPGQPVTGTSSSFLRHEPS